MKTILVDGMHCIYDKNFEVNQKILRILNSFSNKKILVVNGFREKGKEAIGERFEAFSLEEKGIKKVNEEYWKKLFEKYCLNVKDVVYIEHSQEAVEKARSLGVNSILYEGNEEEIKKFLEEALNEN
jgi:FMN phosphatase YigB (HAD superfamily)